MILKILLPIIAILLSSCSDSSSTKSLTQTQKIEQSIEKNLDTDFINWQNSTDKSTELIPSPISTEVLDTKKIKTILKASKLRAVPSAFSLKDTYMTPVRNQGQCGVCWAFATYGAIEGSYVSKSYFDFSEDNLKHLNAYDSIGSYGACSGGNIWKSLGYLSNFRGAVDEVFDPYASSKDSQYCPTCKPSKYIDSAIFVPSRRDINDNDVIKSILYNKKKPLYATMQVGFGSAGESSDSVYEASTFSFYQKNAKAVPNHAVVIVGYDDGYMAQGQKGAFIVKNSWGSEVGDRGYYYVPYADKTIGFGELVYFEDTDESLFKFDNIYSFDNLGATASLSVNTKSIEIANLFRAKSDESIVGANFFVLQSGSSVEVEIHQVISQNPLVTQKIGKTLYSASGILRGFYTANFPLHVSVKKDNLFAVVIRLKNQNSDINLPIEAKISGYASDVSASKGQSFYRSDTQWQDLTDVRSDLNFPIKAMSINKIDEIIPHSLHVNASSNKVLKDENITFSASFEPNDIDIVSLSWDFGDNESGNGDSVIHSYSHSDNYTVRAIAVASDAKSYTATLKVDVLNTPMPTLLDANLSLFENAKEGDEVGQIPINFSGTATIVLSGFGSEKFTVAPDGKVYVAKGAKFNYEEISKYNLSALSINGPGVDSSVNVKIDVLNVNEFRPTLSAFSANIAENSPANTQVGRVNIISSGDSPISSMSLGGNGAADFDITSNGVITVSSTASLDYESVKSYALSVTATNAAGTSAAVSAVINLTNVAETVPVLSSLNTSILENSPSGSEVGKITIVSTGDTPISVIALSGSGSDDFSVDTAGVIKVANSKTIDFERQNRYDLRAVATNLKGSSSSVDVNITIINEPEIKPIIEDFAITVVENVTKNSLLGTINITQIGDTPISAINLSGDGSSDFLVSTDGNITVGIANLDYEKRNHYLLNATAVNGAGDSNSSSVEITVTNAPAITTALIKADDATADDYFSNSISLNKDRVLSGAFREDAGGAVYLHVRNTNGSYSQSVKIASSDIQPDDDFGYDVSIDGNLIVVGTPKEDENGTDAGAVYLFKYFEVDKSALELVKLRSSDTVAGDHFGAGVYISGDLVLVGAPEHNSTGAVYLYKYSSFDNSLTQKAEFVASAVNSGDGFGSEVRIDDNKILVATSSGEAAYLFTYNNSNDSVNELYTFISSDNTAGDLFGSQIDMKSNMIIIGSRGSDSAYLYRYNTSSIAPNVKKITVDNSGNGIAFGSDVAISDTKILIGSVNEDSVYLYNYNANTFNVEEPGMKFSINSVALGSEVGSEVAINGNLLAVSAPKEDSVASNSGALFIVDTEAENRPYLINYRPTISINENSSTIFTCNVNSVNGSSIEYALSGVDGAVFSISNSGVIKANSLDYENPTDVGSDNTYNINIELKDSANMRYSYPMKIDVLNVND